MHFLNWELVYQSTPSLLLSLIVLTLTGKLLGGAHLNDACNKYPFMLISSCILSFKESTELIIAMKISTMNQSKNTASLRLEFYILENFYVGIAQSFLLGIGVGFLGSLKAIFCQNGTRLSLKIITFSILTCTISFISFFLLIFFVINLISNLKLNPDNVFLPIVSSLNDLLAVVILILTMKWIDNKSKRFTIFVICFLIALMIYPMYMSVKDISFETVQKIKTLIPVYGFTVFNGYILDYCSNIYVGIAVLSPVFCGLSDSIANIYLSKRETSIENKQIFNGGEIVHTLIFISFLTSIIYLAVAYCLIIDLNALLIILFTIFFVLEVVLLIVIMDLIGYLISGFIIDQGVVLLPTITAISDFLGVIFLFIILFLVEEVGDFKPI